MFASKITPRRPSRKRWVRTEERNKGELKVTHILVTHAPGESARASLVVEKLGKLGFEVRQEAGVPALSPRARAALKARVDQASCVLVLWSREAADAPALFATAKRAQAAGKLAFARLDSAPTPMSFRTEGAANLAHWMGRAETRPWRRLVAAVGAKTASKTPQKARVAVATKPPQAAAKRGPGVGVLLGGFIALFGVLALGAYLLLPQ
jgi:hypothetical protein